jgi:hypothetical protein
MSTFFSTRGFFLRVFFFSLIFLISSLFYSSDILVKLADESFGLFFLDVFSRLKAFSLITYPDDLDRLTSSDYCKELLFMGSGDRHSSLSSSSINSLSVSTRPSISLSSYSESDWPVVFSEAFSIELEDRELEDFEFEDLESELDELFD